MVEKFLGVFVFGFIGLLFICSAIAPLIEYSLYIIPILLVCFSPFAIGMINGARIKHKEKLFRATLLNPDKLGLYPIPTDQKLISLQQPVLEIAQIYHTHRQPKVPHSFTFAPRLTSNAQTSERGGGSDLLPQLVLPSYSDLPFKPGEILLGYTLDMLPRYAQRETLISTLLGGSTNTGKSTLMRLILSQYLAQDCSISILDPHYLAGKDSLGKSFDGANLFSPTAYEKESILSTIKLFDHEIDNRLQGSGNTKPLILVVDEFTGLLSNGDIHDPLAKLINKISSQSRKVFVYTFAIAQQFHRDLVPSTIRNGFTHYLSTKSRVETALLLSGSKAFAKEVEMIDGYQCVYQSLFSDPERLYVPNTTQKDVEGIVLPSTRVVDRYKTGTTEVHNQKSSLDQLVCSHLKLGDSMNTIVKVAYGIDGKGSKYSDALQDIRRIISENLK